MFQLKAGNATELNVTALREQLFGGGITLMGREELPATHQHAHIGNAVVVHLFYQCLGSVTAIFTVVDGNAGDVVFRRKTLRNVSEKDQFGRTHQIAERLRGQRVIGGHTNNNTGLQVAEAL